MSSLIKRQNFFRVLREQQQRLEQQRLQQEAIKNNSVLKILVAIGINYKGTNSELKGCYLDMTRFVKLAESRMTFDHKHLYTDMDPTCPAATFNNLLNLFSTVLRQSQNLPPNKKTCVIYFFYSGHGTYTPDRDKDEKCGYDNCFVTQDLRIITDDLFHQLFLSKLGSHVSLVGVADCCFSGSIFDLGYMYHIADNNITKENNKPVQAKIVQISGCREIEYSYEVNQGGILTTAMLKILNDQPTIDMKTLVQALNIAVQAYPQRPLLTCTSGDLIQQKFWL